MAVLLRSVGRMKKAPVMDPDGGDGELAEGIAR